MKPAHNRKEYVEGQRVGHCVFLKEDGVFFRGKEPKRAAIFLCKCGKQFRAIINEIKVMDTTSCGCGIIRLEKREYRKYI